MTISLVYYACFSLTFVNFVCAFGFLGWNEGINCINQLLQLSTARTAWSDSVIRSVSVEFGN